MRLLGFTSIKTSGRKLRAGAILAPQWHVMEAFEWSLDRKQEAVGGRWQASHTPFSSRVGGKTGAPQLTTQHLLTFRSARDLVLIAEEWWLSLWSSFTQETITDNEQREGGQLRVKLSVHVGQKIAILLLVLKGKIQSWNVLRDHPDHVIESYLVCLVGQAVKADSVLRVNRNISGSKKERGKEVF